MSGATASLTALGSASLAASLSASSALTASSVSGLSLSASSAPSSSEAAGCDFSLVFGQGGDDGGVGSVGGPDTVGSVEDGYI